MEFATILDFAFKGFLAICQLALFIYVRNTNRNDEVDSKFTALQSAQKLQGDDLGGKSGQLSQRLAHLATAVDSAPTHSDLSKVYEAINELATTVNQLVGENRGQSDTLRLILSQITQKGMK
jgi:ABC-type transporter Mla subunit MlaD